MENASNIKTLFKECFWDNQYKIKKYTVDFKLKVIKLIESNVSLHVISDKLNLDKKILRDWRDKKESLLAVKNKNNKYRCNRKKGEKNFFSSTRR